MVNVVADDAGIEAILNRLVDSVVNNGGEIHPNISLVAQDGHQSILAHDNIPAGYPILRITKDMVIPMDEIELKAVNDQFSITFKSPDQASPVQRQVTETTFELFNYMGKFAYHKTENFWLRMQPHLEILDSILAGRTASEDTKKMRAHVQNNFTALDLDQYICDDFVKSRVLTFKSSKTGTAKRGIMTIIDFLNHHPGGAHYQTLGASTGEFAGVSITCSQPVAGNPECFAFYRALDAMDTFMNYGFVDTSPTFVRSVPIEIPVPDFGKIVVESRNDTVNKSVMAREVQDLGFFIPVIKKDDDVLTASHLLIPGPSAPRALRRVLGMLIVSLAGNPVETDRILPIIRQAEKEIIEKNRSFYQGLLSESESALENYQGDETLSFIQEMARTQLANLDKYKCLD